MGYIWLKKLLEVLWAYKMMTRTPNENIVAASKDPLHVPVGPITRARSKRIKESLNGLILDIWAKQASRNPLSMKLGFKEGKP